MKLYNKIQLVNMNELEKAFYLKLAKEAFYLGFSISREGFNAEYPYKCFLDGEKIDPRLEEDWAELRDKILKDEGIINEVYND